jgi:hypothetical protein
VSSIIHAAWPRRVCLVPSSGTSMIACLHSFRFEGAFNRTRYERGTGVVLVLYVFIRGAPYNFVLLVLYFGSLSSRSGTTMVFQPSRGIPNDWRLICSQSFQCFLHMTDGSRRTKNAHGSVVARIVNITRSNFGSMPLSPLMVQVSIARG